MSLESRQIVQKLWYYCNVLRDDGLSYPDYVEQLTYLLFLKMAHEQEQAIGGRAAIVPEGFDWPSLVSKRGTHLDAHYRAILGRLSDGVGMLGIIFHKAQNKIRDPDKLHLLVADLIDRENWSTLETDVKGDAYEGLLEKNAQDTKSGAGQYFTPRPLIQAIVEVIRPGVGEAICDPACGTCGFLLAAHDHIRRSNPRLTPDQERHLRLEAIRGVELVDAVTRLGAMNLLLHGIGPIDSEGDPPIRTDDSLRIDPGDRFDVVLTNPPFGRKSSVTVVNNRGSAERSLTILRDDFWASTSNKQLSFLQHVRTILRTNGRAAVVVPDNVLFEGGAGETIRRRLLHDCEVHTLLRLPTGIFYAQGVKANVLFFDRKRKSTKPATIRLWVYDLRTDVHVSLKANRLKRSDLDEFVACYRPTDRPSRAPTWSADQPRGRWRAFEYDELSMREGCNLDLAWIQEAGINGPGDPDAIAAEIAEDLQEALEQLASIATRLNGSM